MPSRRRAFHAPTCYCSPALRSPRLAAAPMTQEGPPDAPFREIRRQAPEARQGDGLPCLWLQGADAVHLHASRHRRVSGLDGAGAAQRQPGRRAQGHRLRHCLDGAARGADRRHGSRTAPAWTLAARAIPTQQDCVDEATNTTSYLLVLDRHGLLKHHAVERPFAKDSLTHWTHWAAVIRETDNGERFAIDSSAGVNGENPTVQAAASFYVPDTYADRTPPETGLATAEAQAPRQGSDGLSALARAHASARLCGRRYRLVTLVSAGWLSSWSASSIGLNERR